MNTEDIPKEYRWSEETPLVDESLFVEESELEEDLMRRIYPAWTQKATLEDKKNLEKLAEPMEFAIYRSVEDIYNIPARISVSRVQNAAQTVLLTVVYLGVMVPYAEVFAVGRLGNIRSIGRSGGGGKVDSAESIAYSDGTVRLFVAQAEPGGSGSSTRIKYYDFKDAVAVL